MGLDQYLYARMVAPVGSELAKVIEDNISIKEREEAAHVYEDGSKGSAYVSGWTYGGQTPGPLYEALVKATVRPTEDSPHFNIESLPDGGWLVDATIYYWRKANAIHRWFVERAQAGVDDCGDHEVHPELLMELLEHVDTVVKDHSKAGDLLPTQAGFFFGSTDYDEWYWKDLEETAVGLRKQIAATPPGSAFVYHSSW